MNIVVVGLLEVELLVIKKTITEADIDIIRDYSNLKLESYDLLIIDPITLSKSDLEIIIREVKKHLLKVIVLRALKHIELAELKMRYEKYISKPYLINELQEVVAQIKNNSIKNYK
jgi:pyruvate/2-oxoglutarate/acetoin dehydrogenase E1 component